ncbi:MAG: PGPGW domain-containing protein [Bryobacteraceae bacterium]
MKKYLRIAGGIVLVLIGIVGIILPIMPGWIFIVPGLVILAEYFPSVKRLVDWAKRKMEEHDPRRKRTPSAKLEDHP